MKAIDMRCRPPLPSLLSTRIYNTEYATGFAKRFGDSYIAESAKNRSIEQLFQEMDATNIELGVYEVRAGADCSVNDEAMAFLVDHADRFVGLVGTDAFQAANSVNVIEKYVLQGPFIGVNLEPGSPATGYDSIFVDDESLFPIYEISEKNDLPLTITFGGCAYPDATAYMPIRIENVLRQFPKLRLGLCHGAWPWFKEYGGLMVKYPNLRIIADSYIMYLPGYQDYIHAANYLLRDQILFGTAYPYHDQKRVYDFYMHAGFRDEVLPKVMYDNAVTFLKLER